MLLGLKVVFEMKCIKSSECEGEYETPFYALIIFVHFSTKQVVIQYLNIMILTQVVCVFTRRHADRLTREGAVPSVNDTFLLLTYTTRVMTKNKIGIMCNYNRPSALVKLHHKCVTLV